MAKRKQAVEVPAVPRQFKDRILRLDRVKSSELAQNPKNWRTHPEAQQAAMRGVLSEIGWTDALIARQLPDGTLELIDGHLRASVDPDEVVPVLIVDVTEEESDKLLTILDPLTAMAGVDSGKLADLLNSVSFDTAGMNVLLESLQVQCTELTLSEIANATPLELPADDSDPTEEVVASSDFVNMSFPVTQLQEIEIRRLIKVAKNIWAVESSGLAISMALSNWETLRGAEDDGEDSQEG
jgi:hypothetical protein